MLCRSDCGKYLNNGISYIFAWLFVVLYTLETKGAFMTQNLYRFYLALPCETKTVALQCRVDMLSGPKLKLERKKFT